MIRILLVASLLLVTAMGLAETGELELSHSKRVQSELVQSKTVSRIVESLSQAIRFQTISYENQEKIDYRAYESFTAFLQTRFPLAFTQLTVEPVNQYSLLLRWSGSNNSLKPVMFDGHYDVVPIEPGTENDWTQPAFSGAIVDDTIWGRGAIDNKGGVIAMLEGIEALVSEGYKPKRKLLFSIVHDEEIGGLQGAAKMAEKLLAEGIELEYLVGEGGFIFGGSPMLPEDSLMAMIATAEKGYVTLNLSAKSEGGHSSRPPADSAIVRLAKAVTVLHENPFEAELVAPATDMFEALAPYEGGIRGFMMANTGLFGGMIASSMAKDANFQGMVRTTTAVTKFNSGVKENVIPQSATASVNFRLLPNISPKQLIDIVKQKINDPSIDIALSRDVPLGGTLKIADKEAVGYRIISESIAAADQDIVVVPGLFLATTDARHYGELTDNIYRFHALTVDADDASMVHGTNERISFESIERGFNITLDLIRRAGLN